LCQETFTNTLLSTQHACFIGDLATATHRATLTAAIVVLFLLFTPIFGASSSSSVIPSSSSNDWPMFHHDPSHSGAGTGNPTLTPTLLWNQTIGGLVGPPTIINNILYVGTALDANNGSVYAFNAENGAQLWNVSFVAGPYEPPTAPAVFGKTIFMGGWNSILALNITNGNMTWNYFYPSPVRTEVISSPTTLNGVAYVAFENGNIYAFNATDFTQLWSSRPGIEIQYSSPAVVNDILYIGSTTTYASYVNPEDGVYAVNATNGNSLWNFTNIASVNSSPAVADGKVYVGSWDGTLYALNGTSGSQIWNYHLHSLNTTSSIRIWNNTPTERQFSAIDAGAVSSSPAVAKGIVYVGTLDGNLYAMNATNGDRLWNFTTGGWVVSSPAVVGGVIYFGSYDNNIYALNATNGKLMWNYTTGGEVDSSPAVVNGILYVGSNDGTIYALGTLTAPSPSPSMPFSTKTLSLIVVGVVAVIVALVVLLLVYGKKAKRGD
jgi:eukaryotic-like serine/threonine-protein kinase